MNTSVKMEKTKTPRSSGRVLKKRPSKRKMRSELLASKRWDTDTDQSDVTGVFNELDKIKMNSSSSSSALPTASEKKLANFQPLHNNTSIIKPTSCTKDYIMIHKSVWPKLFNSLSCGECGEKTITLEIIRELAFAAELEAHCSSCGNRITFFSSPKELQYDVNKRIVDAFLSIGKGSSALDQFSMTMGMNSMDRKTFSKCTKKLAAEGELVKENVLKRARKVVREAHEEVDHTLKGQNVINIGVSYDGTWQKRGHTSLYGIGFVIDILTGLVLDYEILSKYCPECTAKARILGQDSSAYTLWYADHKSNCEKNFNGSSNSMEVNIAGILWKRSVEVCNMQYTTILSDGDAKSFVHLQSLNVYGPNVVLEKEECLNHISKRLSTALRNCVKECRIKGVTLGGKKRGSLKDETITKLANYYRKAIKDNIPSLVNIKTAVFASLFHCKSTDSNPRHEKCPGGITSWCFYNRALAKGEKPAPHNTMKTTLREEVVAKILPIYQRLASNELLSRCCRGQTQNTNESLHSVVWSKCPKEIFVSKKRLNLAVIAAVSEFNMGSLTSVIVKESYSHTFCDTAKYIAYKKDTTRILQSQKRNQKRALLFRQKIRNIKTAVEAARLKAEGKTYDKGSF